MLGIVLTMLAQESIPAEPVGSGSGLLGWTALELLSAGLGLAAFWVLAKIAERFGRHEFWIVAASLVCWGLVFAVGWRDLGWDYDPSGFNRGHLATTVGAATWVLYKRQPSPTLAVQPVWLMAVPVGGWVLVQLLYAVGVHPSWGALFVGLGQLLLVGIAATTFGHQDSISAPTAVAETPPDEDRVAQPPPPVTAPAAEPAPARPSSRIFISYRREDSAYITDRIDERLIQRFGRAAVFKDVDSIPLGQDFRRHLRHAVGQCDVLLAVIGRDWLAPDATTGLRRIDDPRDHLRIEVESALERDIPVIPVLVQGALVPPEDQLPEPLRPLAYRNAQHVRPDPDFANDMDRLMRGIEAQLRS